MRDIKFRGKDLETGKWVYGSLLQDDYGTYQLVDFIDHHETWHDIVPETVGQYTGLKDKNGKEIYEEDILNIQFGKENTVPMLVQFVEGGWQMQEHLDYDEYHYLYDYLDDATIVGNIHDNPKLLKGGQQ